MMSFGFDRGHRFRCGGEVEVEVGVEVDVEDESHFIQPCLRATAL